MFLQSKMLVLVMLLSAFLDNTMVKDTNIHFPISGFVKIQEMAVAITSKLVQTKKSKPEKTAPAISASLVNIEAPATNNTPATILNFELPKAEPVLAKPEVKVAAKASSFKIEAVKKKELPYQYWVQYPEGYKESDQQFPLLLFLHGRSLTGNNLDMVKEYGVIYEILRGQKVPFVVIAPQTTTPGWNNKKLIELLDYVQQNYKVDACRTYVTGMSMGGYGAWMLAGAHPERFAACAPVCGGGDVRDAGRLVKMPTWVFHGAKDRAVSINESHKMVNAIKAKKGDKIQFTIYKNDGHSDLVKVFRMNELYDWFLQHELK